MKKYNLSIDEFRKVIMLFAQEERKVLEQLETDTQRDSYLKIKNQAKYEDWFTKPNTNNQKQAVKHKKAQSNAVEFSPRLQFHRY